MSAATTTTTTATAAPATATGAGLLGGDAPATTGTATGTTTSTVSAVTTAATNDATAAWTESIADPTLKAYVTNKGWKDGAEAANGYMHLEKLLGSEKLPMPKGDQDVEGWNRVYKAIGRPETPEGYKLPVPQGGDDAFSKDAAKKFHEAGLSAKQAQTLAQWYSEYGNTLRSAGDESINRRNATELEAYKREQGSMFDARVEMGKRAARQFGWTNDELANYERTFGTRKLLERFSAMGEGLIEHVVAGEGEQAFSMSATAAQARITMLKTDKEFVARYTSGDVKARDEMFALSAAAAGMTTEQYRDAMGMPKK